MNNLDEHQGWQVLSRAMLHTWQTADEYHSDVIQVLDHCRRLILWEEYPTNESIRNLLRESRNRISQLLYVQA